MNKNYSISTEKATLRVTVCTDKIIRVTYGKDPEAAVKQDSIMVSADLNILPVVETSVSETDSEFAVSTSQVRVRVDKGSLAIRFERPDGTLLSREYGADLQEYEMYRNVGGNTETR